MFYSQHSCIQILEGLVVNSLARTFGYVDMEIGFDLVFQLEEHGLDQDTIDDIMEDYESSQKLGLQRPEDFVKAMLDLYKLKDGQLLSDFRDYLYDPVTPHL